MLASVTRQDAHSGAIDDEVLDLDEVRIDPAWALRIPAAFALRKRVLPLCQLDQRIVVACSHGCDALTQKALSGYLKSEFRVVRASPESLRRALSRVYESPSIGGDQPASGQRVRPRLESPTDGENATSICDELLQAAILRGASDIHLVPGERTLAAQLRVDGQLELYRELPSSNYAAVISRLKVLAGLDIAEKRAPQDGRISSHFVGNSRRKLDIRVATLPTRYGERMTLRLLASNEHDLSLPGLGMRPEHLEQFSTAAGRPHGLVLLTGPTGSGKSTTLYVAIEQLLRNRGGNVITIEDPIEYEIRGASQVEVDSADKVNFSKALRSVLRHDPDVVMIGEIRDAETANIAVKASLTGHLVFSTLHTNTAAGVVTRLADMGIERFLIAATLRLSVAQRLVRRLCPRCRQPRAMSNTEAFALGRPELTGQTVYDPVGCIVCAGRGYAGRIGLFEMLACNEDLARIVAGGGGEEAILEYVQQRKMPMLSEDGVAKILDGTTSVAEVSGAVTTW